MSKHAHAERHPVMAAIEVTIGVGALYGGWSLMTDAEGFGVRTAWLHGSPFADYTVPAIVLAAGIGGGMLAAAVLCLRGDRMAPAAAMLMGIALLAFLIVETAIVGYHGGPQAVLLAGCGAAAIALIAGSRRTG